MPKLNDYIPIVGRRAVEDLEFLASKLKGKKVQHINSTSVGGGVAEILNRMVPLLNELGVESSWNVVKGGEKFYQVTKKFHNALHGRAEEFSKEDFDLFIETGEQNASEMKLDSDIMFIHDPQPVTLVNRKTDNKWIWRCHVDVSNPDRKVWEFLEQYIKKYDASVFSAPGFSQVLPIRQFQIPPSIDPLSDKNKELPCEQVNSIMEKLGVPQDKPIILQISRFDRLKDPVGVLEVYKLVRKYIDCRLVLAGGGASDDPEGLAVLAEVREKAGNDENVHILLLPQDDIIVNALQRAATVILQKSLKEGFGLTVSEALWKGKPVVASYVGGIPMQITNKYSGMLSYSVEGTAFAVKQILNHPKYAAKLGENGKEHVRNNFLLTRHLKEYLLLFISLYQDKDIVYL